jgi:putative transposase
VSQWKRQLLDGARELFTMGNQSKNKDEGPAKEAELFQQIGRLRMELKWFKKNLSGCDARELRTLVDHDNSERSIIRQCAHLGLPRSTLHDRTTPVRESTLRILAKINT